MYINELHTIHCTKIFYLEGICCSLIHNNYCCCEIKCKNTRKKTHVWMNICITVFHLNIFDYKRIHISNEKI